MIADNDLRDLCERIVKDTTCDYVTWFDVSMPNRRPKKWSATERVVAERDEENQRFEQRASTSMVKNRIEEKLLAAPMAVVLRDELILKD